MIDWAFTFSIPLVQNMFISIFVACVLCGVVGTLVVVKRMVSMTGGIAHTIFGGVGLAYYLQSVILVSWFTPMIGAAVFAIAAAVIMSLPVVQDKIRQDSVIGVLWATGMALGVIFISFTDRSVVVPRSYESILFGDALLVGRMDIYLLILTTVIVVSTIAYFYRDLQVLTFDETYAKISGIKVTAMNMMLYLMVAITCVLVTNIIGIILILALITIPVLMANIYAYELKSMMILSVLISIVISFLGLIISIIIDSPPGATVAVVLGILFILVMVLRSITKVIRNSIQEIGV